MSEAPDTPPLTPDAANRLAEFARVCKAAARAVSLYPGGHPAIGVSLTRLEQATERLTDGGPYKVQVLSDGLLIEGARMAKPDPAVAELAALLHRHLIGRLTLNAGANAESWRTLLLLLARSPEEVRTDGGIGRLWATAGGPSLEISEIDYAEVLREKQGLAATIDSIIEAAMSGPTLTVDDAAIRAVVDIIQDSAKLEQLMLQIELTASRSPQGVELQTAALLNIVRGLVDYVGRTDPQQLNTIFEQFGQGVRHLSVEAMIALLAERQTARGDGGQRQRGERAHREHERRIGRRVRRRLGRGGTGRLRASRARVQVPGAGVRSPTPAPRAGARGSGRVRHGPRTGSGGVQRPLERRRTDADVVHRRALRLGGLRARALARPHAAGRRRARQRRPSGADRGVARDGQRRGPEKPRSGSADRSSAHRTRPVPLARHRRHGHHARRRSGSRGQLRVGVAPDRDGHRTGERQPVPAPARDRGARSLRARIAHQAHRPVSAVGRRCALRAIQAHLPRDRPIDRRAARRGARDRAARRSAEAAAGCPGRIRTEGRGSRTAAAQRAAMGDPPHGGLPAAGIRRGRRSQGTGAAAHRRRTARAAARRCRD